MTYIPVAHAQSQPLFWALRLQDGQHWPETLRVVLDADDDDANGEPDRMQRDDVPDEDLAHLRLIDGPRTTPMHLSVSDGLRLVRGGKVLANGQRLEPGDVWPAIQGVHTSTAAGDAWLELTVEGKPPIRLPVTVVALTFLDARNRPLQPATDALALSRQVTHDRTLPRDAHAAGDSPDPENFRIALHDASAGEVSGGPALTLSAVAARSEFVHHMLRHIPTTAGASTGELRTPFLRLVGDRTDLSAPDVADRLLAVRLRDRVRVGYHVGRTELFQDIRVGAPGARGGARAALRGRLRLRALRLTPGGVPVIGRSDLDAIGLLREQVEVANEIWLQCGIDFGSPDAADSAVVDPPPPALLAISDGDGLPATGGGLIRLSAAGRQVSVSTRARATPAQTALRVAAALHAKGLRASVTVNSATEYGAGRSADIVVRDRNGALVALSPWPDQPLSSDRSQRARIGAVDLSDGIEQFDNMNAAAGTLEERSLVKLLTDDDPTTIDILVVNRFLSAERQGEAFIEGDGGAIVNTLIVDRNGIRFQRQAWVQSHELGHVLLDAPYHPDSIGPDRPWLLMDADARQGRVTGPKRLTRDECERVRRQSGPEAHPPLLLPHPD